MRALVSVFALASVFALSACGGDDSSSNDQAVSHDLAVTTGDAAVKSGCFAVATCAQKCSSNSCTAACVAAGTTGAQQKFAALFACGYSVCLPSDAGDSDGGAGSCTSSTDQSAVCVSCLNSAVFTPACSSEFSACAADQ